MNSQHLPPPLPRTAPPAGGFVTVLGWISLAMATLGALYGAMQIVSGLMFPGDRYLRLLSGNEGALPSLPPLMQWIYTHTLWMGVLMVALSLLLLLVSWALLKRREWGRKLFIALLVIGTLWQFASLFALPQLIEGTLAMQAGVLPQGQDMPPEIQAFMRGAMWMGGAVSVVFAGVHAWLIWKLCTPAIRAQFETSTDR
jgi:hypothetical protein